MPREVEQLALQPRDPSPMGDIMETLPTYRSRALIYLLVLLAVALTVYAAFGKVDMIVSAPAALVPVGLVKPIQADAEGVIAEIPSGVQEGKLVEKGAVLVSVDAKEVSPYLFTLRNAEVELADAHKDVNEVLLLRKNSMEIQVAVLNKRIAGLDNTAKSLGRRIDDEKQGKLDTEKSHDLELKKHGETVKRLEVEKRNAERAADLWRKEVNANARLRGKSVVTELQFLNVQRSHEEALANVQKNESMISEAAADKLLIDKKFENARSQHDRTLAELQDQLQQAQTNRGAAEAEIAQRREEYAVADKDAHRKLELAKFRREQAWQQAKLNLRGYDDERLNRVAAGKDMPSNRTDYRAPVEGYIAKLLVRNPGEPVQRGQTLLTVVPADLHLVAELRVANRDIGQIKYGQDVRLKLDAFPFAEHGVIYGKLDKPLPDAEVPEGKGGESYYRVHATLSQQYIPVHDEHKQLLSGMTALAEVETERKTILELVLKPLMELGKPRPAKKD